MWRDWQRVFKDPSGELLNMDPNYVHPEEEQSAYISLTRTANQESAGASTSPSGSPTAAAKQGSNVQRQRSSAEPDRVIDLLSGSASASEPSLRTDPEVHNISRSPTKNVDEGATALPSDSVVHDISRSPANETDEVTADMQNDSEVRDVSRNPDTGSDEVAAHGRDSAPAQRKTPEGSASSDTNNRSTDATSDGNGDLVDDTSADATPRANQEDELESFNRQSTAQSTNPSTENTSGGGTTLNNSSEHVRDVQPDGPSTLVDAKTADDEGAITDNAEAAPLQTPSPKKKSSVETVVIGGTSTTSTIAKATEAKLEDNAPSSSGSAKAAVSSADDPAGEANNTEDVGSNGQSDATSVSSNTISVGGTAVATNTATSVGVDNTPTPSKTSTAVLPGTKTSPTNGSSDIPASDTGFSPDEAPLEANTTPETAIVIPSSASTLLLFVVRCIPLGFTSVPAFFDIFRP